MSSTNFTGWMDLRLKKYVQSWIWKRRRNSTPVTQLKIKKQNKHSITGYVAKSYFLDHCAEQLRKTFWILKHPDYDIICQAKKSLAKFPYSGNFPEFTNEKSRNIINDSMALGPSSSEKRSVMLVPNLYLKRGRNYLVFEINIFENSSHSCDLCSPNKVVG